MRLASSLLPHLPAALLGVCCGCQNDAPRVPAVRQALDQAQEVEVSATVLPSRHLHFRAGGKQGENVDCVSVG